MTRRPVLAAALSAAALLAAGCGAEVRTVVDVDADAVAVERHDVRVWGAAHDALDTPDRLVDAVAAHAPEDAHLDLHRGDGETAVEVTGAQADASGTLPPAAGVDGVRVDIDDEVHAEAVLRRPDALASSIDDAASDASEAATAAAMTWVAVELRMPGHVTAAELVSPDGEDVGEVTVDGDTVTARAPVADLDTAVYARASSLPRSLRASTVAGAVLLISAVTAVVLWATRGRRATAGGPPPGA